MRRATLYAVVLVSFGGCGSGESGRVPVKGTVTYEGRPVAWGSIALRPTPGTKGPAAGTDIVDGKYEIPATAGPATGAYTARITIVQQDESQTTPQPFARGPGKLQSLEIPLEIRADRATYHIRLPLEYKLSR